MARLTVVLPATHNTEMLGLQALRHMAQPARRSLAVSVPCENATKPKAGMPEALRGAACQRSAGVGAGHPPPKAGPSGSGPLTWWALEKWEGVLGFGREGVLRG